MTPKLLLRFITLPALTLLAPIAASADSPTPVRIGPSFSCATTARDALAATICSDDTLARSDLAFVQAYEALRQQSGPAGAAALRKEAVAFSASVRANCRLPDPGQPVPPITSAGVACVRAEYEKQRQVWLGKLTGTAAEEARRPLDEHLALQRDLAKLGLLPASPPADGVYGPATRAAIIKWQQEHIEPATGLISNADAYAITAETQPVKLSSTLPSQAPALKTDADLKSYSPDDTPDAGQQIFKSTTVSGLEFSSINTGWAITGQPDGGSLCLPFVAFIVKNDTQSSIDDETFEADFLVPDQRQTYGTGKVYWFPGGNLPPLPGGYTRRVAVVGSFGRIYAPGTCILMPRIAFTLRVGGTTSMSDVVSGNVDRTRVSFEMQDDAASPLADEH